MFRFLRRCFPSSVRRNRTPSPCRPRLEALEDRLVPSAGPEFHINTQTAGSQTQPATAIANDGRSVAVWVTTQNGDSDIHAQRYNSAGQRAGNEFVVAGQPGVSEWHPEVAMDQNGNFVVAYTRGLGTSAHVYAQRFNSSGQAQGSPIDVSGIGTADDPAVAMSQNGLFVVSYTAHNNPVLSNEAATVIQARAYNLAAGSPRDFAPSVADGMESSVAMAPDGRIALAWSGQIFNGSSLGTHDIFLERFGADGQFLGLTKVTSTPADEGEPKVASDRSFNLVIGWRALTDPHHATFSAARVSSAGVLGPVLALTSTPATEGHMGAVAVNQSNGSFVAAVNGFATDGTLHGRLIEVSGSNSVRTPIDLGANTWVYGLSSNSAGRYFAGLQANGRSNDPDWGIFGRFGNL